jgi:CO/xanthine dehydrogenase Mo-binding subunit
VAGNLVTASPANDTIAPLLALGAEVVLASAAGRSRAQHGAPAGRWRERVGLSDFYLGVRRTVARPDELLREIRVPRMAPDQRGLFLKLGLRRAQAVELRRRNIYREGSIEPTQQPLPAGVSALPVLERCVEEARVRLGYGTPHPPGFPPHCAGRFSQAGPPPQGPRGETTLPSPRRGRGVGGRSLAVGQPCPAGTWREGAPHLRRGIGIACGMKNVGYSFGFPEQSTATVELFGRAEYEQARVRIGAADVGQGAHLILRQVAAEALELPIEKVEMVCDDSSQTPNAGSASASRLTLMAGRAIYDAVADARKAWSATDDQHLAVTKQYRAPVTTPLEPSTGRCIPNFAYDYAAQAVVVEVSLLTGQVQVLSVISIHDVGKAINRQQVEGQIEGCVAQGLGYALLEHLQVRDGHILTPYLSTYLLPTVLDMPTEVVPVVLELADPNGPYGARGVAEMALVPLLPAIASAIHDATGVWVTQQPITPERVLAALNSSQ